jgi:hypothetical protein
VGWLEPPVAQKWGGRTTPFSAKGWLRPPHTSHMGVAEATPGLWGWFGHPERPQKKKQKNGFWPFGVAEPPPRAWGWPKPPPTAGRGCPKPPPSPRGWSGHPQRPKPILSFFFFFVAFRGGWTTPKGLGWLRPPPYGRYRVAPATLPFPFFFFFFFKISLFFFKKKKS